MKALIEKCEGTILEDCENIEGYPIITTPQGTRVIIGEPNARGFVPQLFLIGNPTRFRRLKYMMALAIGERTSVYFSIAIHKYIYIHVMHMHV